MGNVLFDLSGSKMADRPEPWVPCLVSKEEIDEAVARLCDTAAALNGYRSASIVHPASAESFPSFTPGTDVTINVLLPGESTLALRRNTNQLEICIRGSGEIESSRTMTAGKWDVWTTPAMTPVRYHNTGKDVWVRLTYSNAPLLRKLGAYFCEEGGHIGENEGSADTVDEVKRSIYNMENAPDIALGKDGARLRGYEFLTDITVKENPPLLWKWEDVYPYLPKKVEDNNRSIWLLYNPATAEKQGSNHSYFATWAGAAPGTPTFTGKRGHRHNSASINYHIRGYGKSVVDGEAVEWKAGDLLFSAPSWREHAHYFGPEGTEILTVQDHPMLIGLGNLLWQEDVNGPIFTLGAEPGQKGWTGPREVGA